MSTEWLTAKEAAQHAKCSTWSIYAAVERGALKATRLGGIGRRRKLMFLASWIDAWLLANSTPEIVNPSAPGDDVGPDQVKSAAH